MSISRLRQNSVAQKLKKAFFLLGNRTPASRWYGAYKLTVLTKSLDQPFDPHHLPAGYGQWLDERIVEYCWFFSRLPQDAGKLLDAGSTLNHEFIVSHPKLRDKDIIIMTLAPETQCHWHKRISYLYGDLRKTMFDANVFDYVVSISTLDHIGLNNQVFHRWRLQQDEQDADSYVVAVRELSRVLKPGGRCYISVPYGKRVIAHGFQQVFDGAMIDRLIDEFKPASFISTYFQYSQEKGWHLSDKSTASAARYFNYKMDVRWKGHPAAAEAVVCLELTK